MNLGRQHRPTDCTSHVPGKHLRQLDLLSPEHKLALLVAKLPCQDVDDFAGVTPEWVGPTKHIARILQGHKLTGPKGSNAETWSPKFYRSDNGLKVAPMAGVSGCSVDRL
eukprot:1987491-Amphidinium_carterae.1